MGLTGEKICQSCGMTIEDIVSLGTNEDGSKNYEYCHFCFFRGNFTEPGITYKDMEHKVSGVLSIIYAIPENKSQKIASNALSKLKRWRG